MASAAAIRQALIEIFTQLDKASKKPKMSPTAKPDPIETGPSPIERALMDKQDQNIRKQQQSQVRGGVEEELRGPGPDVFDGLRNDTIIDVAPVNRTPLEEMEYFDSQTFPPKFGNQELAPQGTRKGDAQFKHVQETKERLKADPKGQQQLEEMTIDQQTKGSINSKSDIDHIGSNPARELMDEIDITNRQRAGERQYQRKEPELDVFGSERQKELDMIDQIVATDKGIQSFSPKLFDQVYESMLVGNAIKEVDLNAAIQGVFDRLKEVEAGISDTVLKKYKLPTSGETGYSKAALDLSRKRETLSTASEVARDFTKTMEQREPAMQAIKKINDWLLSPPVKEPTKLTGKGTTTKSGKPSKFKTKTNNTEYERPQGAKALRDLIPEDISTEPKRTYPTPTQRAEGEVDLLMEQLNKNDPNVRMRTVPQENILIQTLQEMLGR